MKITKFTMHDSSNKFDLTLPDICRAGVDRIQTAIDEM
jgi:hypothetical protein